MFANEHPVTNSGLSFQSKRSQGDNIPQTGHNPGSCPIPSPYLQTFQIRGTREVIGLAASVHLQQLTGPLLSGFFSQPCSTSHLLSQPLQTKSGCRSASSAMAVTWLSVLLPWVLGPQRKLLRWMQTCKHQRGISVFPERGRWAPHLSSMETQ